MDSEFGFIYDKVNNGQDVFYKGVIICDIASVRKFGFDKRFQVHSDNRDVQYSNLFETLTDAVVKFQELKLKAGTLHDAKRLKATNRRVPQVPSESETK